MADSYDGAMRFRLRTLLIVFALGPPFIASLVEYRRWRDDRLWQSLETAKRNRDELLVTWRRTYDLVTSGQVNAAQETAIQQRYFAARQDVESTWKSVRARYGNSDVELLRARQVRQTKK
jgi:hypothetical protein